jgi:hypothetical protein
MEKNLIVTSAAESFVKFENYRPAAAFQHGELAHLLGDILNMKINEPMLILFFIHVSEYNDAYLRLRDHGSGDFFIYSFVIFGSPDDLDSVDFKKLHHVSEFRTSSLSGRELEFAVEKSFSILENTGMGRTRRMNTWPSLLIQGRTRRTS